MHTYSMRSTEMQRDRAQGMREGLEHVPFCSPLECIPDRVFVHSPNLVICFCLFGASSLTVTRRETLLLRMLCRSFVRSPNVGYAWLHNSQGSRDLGGSRALSHQQARLFCLLLLKAYFARGQNVPGANPPGRAKATAIGVRERSGLLAGWL